MTPVSDPRGGAAPPEGPAALKQGASVRVHQIKHERRGATYPARVVWVDGTHVVVAAVWTERVAREHFSFEPGDRSIEHYWTDRWYAVWQVHAADGRLKGWYCNVARPVDIDDHHIASVDLELDLWVPGDGGATVRLDEDEFVMSGLAARDSGAAVQARRSLDELEALGRTGLMSMLEPSVDEVVDGGAAWPFAHEPGRVIAVRTVTDHQVRWAAPAVVISDDAAGPVYFRPGGTTNKVTEGTRVTTSRRDRELALRAELVAHRFTVVDHTTAQGPGSLVIAPRGEPFSVWLRKEPSTGSYAPAYVNVERPHRRTPLGFDTDDLCLDLTVDEHTGWTLKDDGDLDERTKAGIYSLAQSRAIRAAAARAIIRIETRQAPFDGAWADWQPDPVRTLPTLPSDWHLGTATAADAIGNRDPSQLVRAGYDAIADQYLAGVTAARPHGPSYARTVEWTRRLLGRLPQGSTVLDIGCGPGVPVDAAIAEAGHRVVGIDLSPRQIDLASQSVPGATFFVADLRDIGVPEGSVDAIVALYSASHLPREAQGPAVATWTRWLRPGGWLLVNLACSDVASRVEENFLGLGTANWTSSWDLATNERLIRDAGLRVADREVLQEPAVYGSEHWLWTLATRPVPAFLGRDGRG